MVVVPQYPPIARVGAFLATHELLTELVQCGHRVDVLTRWAKEPVYEFDGITVGPGGASVTVSTAVACADLVVSHAGDDGTAARLAAQWHKPSVRMMHGYLEDVKSRLEGAALVVFNSHASQRESGYDGRQIVVRPVLRPGVQAMPGDRVTLVNLAEQKGGDLFWRLARAMPETRFLAVRGGYGRQIIDRYPNTEVLPPTENMALDVFSRTRVLLMPSERESWGMTGVEAMSCGIPVIAHPAPGLVESLGEAGIFVDREDPQGWVAAIERLDDPAAWEAASKKALERQTPDDRGLFVEAVESLMVAA